MKKILIGILAIIMVLGIVGVFFNTGRINRNHTS